MQKLIKNLLVFVSLSMVSSLYSQEIASAESLNIPLIIIPMQNDYGRFQYHDKEMNPIKNSTVWELAGSIPGNEKVVTNGRLLSTIGATFGCIAAASLITWITMEVTSSDIPSSPTVLPITFGISLISGNFFSNTAKKKMEYAVHNYNFYNIDYSE